MPKLVFKIALPIILVGIFAIIVFMTISAQVEPGFYIVIFFLTVYIFFFGIATGQKLSVPIKKILDNANELSEGNLSGRVYLETKDEISDLAKVFNKIAEELEENQKQKNEVEKSVGIKVQAKTKELEEVIDALEQKVKNRTVELERLIKEYDRLQQEVKDRKINTNKAE